MTETRLLVIYNPMSGRGRARGRVERLRQLLGGRADFRETSHAGHAEELAFEAAHSGCRTVAVAGGDGTVHEAANGLLRAARPDVSLAVFPVGSANDYAHTLSTDAAWSDAKAPGPAGRLVDVGLVRAPGLRERHFVNGLGLGFNGMVTLESRRIHRLQGVWLYSVALLRALGSHYACPKMTISADAQTYDGPTLALTVAVARREGGFVLAPNAVLDDGLFDYLRAGRLRRWELLRFLPRMITGRLPTDHPEIQVGRCKELRVRSERPLAVHADGEMFCRPQDGVREVEVRLLPAALSVVMPAV